MKKFLSKINGKNVTLGSLVASGFLFVLAFVLRNVIGVEASPEAWTFMIFAPIIGLVILHIINIIFNGVK